MMDLENIADAAQSLSSQLAAGIPALECAELMSREQPEYAEFWRDTAVRMADGRPLSHSLKEEWPPALVSIVEAGERAGKTDAVLNQVEQAVRLQISMDEEIGRLKKPLAVFAFGVSTFLFMILYIIPSFNKSLQVANAASTDWLTSTAISISELLAPIWLPLLGGLAGSAVVLFSWLRTEAGREFFDDALLSAPWFGPAFKDFHYAVWARFLGTVLAAGIPLIEALSLTKAGTPHRLHEGIETFESELRLQMLSVQDAANLKRWPETDQRHEWPEYLRRAFVSGANTGQTDADLMKASNLIMDYAKKRFNSAVTRADTLIFIMCCAMAVIVALAWYLPFFNTLKSFQTH